MVNKLLSNVMPTYGNKTLEFIKGKGPNHVAVFLGDGNIMHHPRNKYLCIEPLNKSLTKTICKIYRHEQFS